MSSKVLFFLVLLIMILNVVAAGAGIKFFTEGIVNIRRVSALKLEDQMIISNLKNKGKLVIEGNISEVSAECILIMREIYKRNKEVYNKEIALGILTNMLVKAVDEKEEEEKDIKWEVSDQEKLAYTE